MSTDLLTPVGRLVQGDVFKGNTTDGEGRPLVIKNGANAGQPRTDYFFAIAIPKTDAAWPAFYAQILAEAQTSFASVVGVEFGQDGKCTRPEFAYKITDGDSTVPNTVGKKPCDREGFPGNWVLGFSSGFAPKVYTAGGAALIVEPTELKRGDYIRISGSVAGNGSSQQPGVYLNHNLVERVGFGQAITGNAPDGATVFGGAPAALPQGASATPVAGAPIAQPTPQPQAAPAPVAAPVAAPAPVAQAPTSVMPAPEFLNPEAEQSYNVNGRICTETELKGWGWTPEQIATQTKA